MALLKAVSKGFWAVGNIGVSEDIRPEEAKHIRYLNIGTFLFCIINLGYFFQSLVDEKSPLIMTFSLISISVLCLVVYVFHMLGRYNTARMYCFLLFFASTLFIYPLTGKEVVDHYFIFVAIAYSFLLFPRKEKVSMTIIIALAIACYLAIMVLYEHVEPIYHLDQSALNLWNQILLYILFIVFIVFMISGRYFTVKTEDSLMEERKKVEEMAALLKIP